MNNRLLSYHLVWQRCIFFILRPSIEISRLKWSSLLGYYNISLSGMVCQLGSFKDDSSVLNLNLRRILDCIGSEGFKCGFNEVLLSLIYFLLDLHELFIVFLDFIHEFLIVNTFLNHHVVLVLLLFLV